jgi:hypothetical protein
LTSSVIRSKASITETPRQCPVFGFFKPSSRPDQPQKTSRFH